MRQAYPGVHKDVIETLAIDHFIDALTDSDIQSRVRKFEHKTLAKAERSALRLESHKIDDRQHNRIFGQIEAKTEKNNGKTQWESSPKLTKLQSSLGSLSDQVKYLQKKNSRNAVNKTFAKTGKYQKTIHTIVDMVKITDLIKIILLHCVVTNRGKPKFSIEIIILVRLNTMASLLRTSLVEIEEDKTTNMLPEMALLTL